MPRSHWGVKKALFLSLALSPAYQAQSFDILSLMEFRSDLSARWHGFRRMSLQDPEDPLCRLSVVRHVRWDSSKPTHFILMGFGDSRVGTYAILEKLPHSRQLWVVEWPRHGASRCENVEKLSDAALRLRRTLHKQITDQSAWIGISLGAVLSLYVAQNEPQARLVWIAPPFIDESLASARQEQIRNIQSPQDVQAFLDLILTPPMRLPDFVLSALKTRLNRSKTMILSADFKEVTDLLNKRLQSQSSAPLTLWIRGTKDALFPKERLQKFNLADSGSHTTCDLDGCGHDMNTKCSGPIANRIATFIPDL